MTSSDESKKEKKDGEKEEEEEEGSFLGKVKDFIGDIGEKIEDAIGCGKPTADVTAIHIPSIDLKSIELVADVLVENPNPVPIPLCDINYNIESEGRKLFSGLIPDAGTLEADGSKIIKVPLTLVYDDIKNTYKDITEGSIIPYKVLIELIADVPIIGQITLPLEKTGEIPVPYKPEVDLVKIKIDDFSLDETTATLHLKLMNKNDFDMGLNSLEYEAWLGDDHIGGARLDKSAKIEKNGEGIVEIPITFRPKDFGSALWDIITGSEASTGYSVKGSIEIDSIFGPMKLPFGKEGGSTELKKADDDNNRNKNKNKKDNKKDDDDKDDKDEDDKHTIMGINIPFM